jgi:type II secretory pathway pseudopilin PulG
MYNVSRSKKQLQRSYGFTIIEFMLALAGGILLVLSAFFTWEKFGSPLTYKYTKTNEFNTILSQAASIRSSWGGTYPATTDLTNIGSDCQSYLGQTTVSQDSVVCNTLANGNQTTLNALVGWGYSCQNNTLAITGAFTDAPGGKGTRRATSILSSIAASVQSDSGWDCTSGNNGSGVNKPNNGDITCVKTGVVCSAQLQ